MVLLAIWLGVTTAILGAIIGRGYERRLWQRRLLERTGLLADEPRRLNEISPSRRIVGHMALVLVMATLAVRIQVLQTPPRIELAPRSRELARIHGVAARVSQYAMQYGRPVYHWDLALPHVTAAESTAVEGLRADLYEDGLYFRWDDSTFYIASPRYGGISETFGWPAGVPEYARARLIALTPK
jgi:hypothetical protein